MPTKPSERLADMSSRARKEVVRRTLAPILRRLNAPVETRFVVQEIADILGTNEHRLITALMISLAKHELGPDQVRQTGEVFYRFGRPMRRWQWGPLPPDYDPGLTKPMSEEDMWTIYPEDEPNGR